MSAGAEALFAAVLAEQPSQPLVTYYNDASGERIELSAKSLANWVAKTHFLLLDELGLGVGDTALVALPADWITIAILLGCWSAGLCVAESATEPTGAAVAFVEPGTAHRATSVPDAYAINLASMTRSFTGDTPAGTTDYVAAVRPQPDVCTSVKFPAGPADPAVDGLNRAELVSAAQTRAAELGLGRGARVLFDRPWTGSTDWIEALLVPMAVGGSVVLVANADPGRRDRRIEQEQVTAAF